MRSPRHTIHHRNCCHFGWDASLKPALTLAPGETVEVATVDASGGALKDGDGAEAILALDPARANPVTGPIAIDGAEPGDGLRVHVLDIDTGRWGWTANIPGFGLLADQFPDPALHHWQLDQLRDGRAVFNAAGAVTLRPMIGTLGLAPAEPGPHSVIPPRRVGGNMDMRDLAIGTEVLLPVEVAGALLSVGDAHAAQGDGEVCGTAIETTADLRLKITLEKGAAPRFPQLIVPPRSPRARDEDGWDVTTGIGPDLMAGARDAVMQMIDLLCAREKVSPVEAYMLCSVCGDLRIAEIVDAPNWVVAFHMPRTVFA